MLACALMIVLNGALPVWEFDDPGDLQAWEPNRHLSNVVLQEGVVRAEATDWDPFFLNRSVQLEAGPYQGVVIRIRADKPGVGDFFWSGQLDGEYGGLTEAKKVRFAVRGNNQWEEIVLFPFWHPEGTIRQLRLDVYVGAHFDIDFIRVFDWGHGAPQQSETFSWTFAGETSGWQIHPRADELFAPPLRLAVEDRGYVAVRLASEKEGSGSVLWACGEERGLQTQQFTIRGDGRMHTYNVELAAIPSWRDPIVAFGIRLLRESKVRLESIAIVSQPWGPPELETVYFGFENAPNRVNRPCRVRVRVTNQAGDRGSIRRVRLVVPKGLRVLEKPQTRSRPGIEFKEYEDFSWVVAANQSGAYPVRAAFGGKGAPKYATTTLEFSEAPAVERSHYVPEPQPVQPDIDLCAFYFPGWNSPAAWDCIEQVAPNRKPVLGYYDESNPECVDWQIKWAVENGISCFLVDWYWRQGAQHLTHWFEAYRKAKYRDYLQVAIMWANHNPPGSHSVADWQEVTQHWLEHYFTLDSYYRIDGKPAVFIWSPENIRKDLGGSEIVRACLEESQGMAQAAGYDGITFVAMGYDFSSNRIEALIREGYSGITTYHEWGAETEAAYSHKRAQFEKVVETSPTAWLKKDEAAGALTYYPVVETGWDSRPWHGDNAFVIAGRTPDLFEALLRQAKTFCQEAGKRILVVGPVNEWGEGSYIEPCTEFGFEMLERLRTVFAAGTPSPWPVNVAPSDVALGPYDFPALPDVTAWDFSDPRLPGWTPLMNVAEFRCEDGVMQFRTTSDDAAIHVPLHGTPAEDFPRVSLLMRLTGEGVKSVTGQLFWSSGGAAVTEATSMRFPVHCDGQWHAYTLEVAANPRWRGRISRLRLDPCDQGNVRVEIDEIELHP